MAKPHSKQGKELEEIEKKNGTSSSSRGRGHMAFPWFSTTLLLDNMAKKYGAGAQKSVKAAMHKMKAGKLKSGKSKKTVRSRKQAIAIGLSEARKKGAKVPKKPATVNLTLF